MNRWQGAYGEVYLVKWRGTEVAAKTIRSSIASNKTVKWVLLLDGAASFLIVYIVIINVHLLTSFHSKIWIFRIYKNWERE